MRKRRNDGMPALGKVLLAWAFSAVLIAAGCGGRNDPAVLEEKQDSDKPASGSGQTAEASVSAKVTFVELGSVNCIPCRMMQPIIEEIKKEYPDVRVVFYDVRTPEGAEPGRKYRIRLIPTQVFLDENGNEYFRHEGFFPKEDLVEILRRGGAAGKAN